MLATDNVTSHEYDLFGVRPATRLPDVDSPDPVVVRVRAKRALKGSITAATVDPRVARSFALRSLFPELVSIEASRANAAAHASAILSSDDSADVLGCDALAIPDDEDSAAFECGPASSVTDDQLRSELAAWQLSLSDAEVALVLWRMQVAQLEENLAFLMSVDTKPRVTMEKAYILQWVFTEDVVNGCDFRKNHMSFHICCKAYGFNDPNEFRLKLLQVDLIRKLVVALHLYREHELPPLRKVASYADIVGEDRAVPDNSVYQYEGM